MQFLTALFGGTAGTLLNAVFALGIVLVLVVLALWLMKLLGRAGDSVARGRQRRLVVVDTAPVDGRRRVVLIRRDNVEHVIMTGGPQDLVIETGIPVAAEPAEARRSAAAAPRRPAAAPARPTPAADIATPVTSDQPVTRDTVDRLNDLARPAPLRPRPALRHTALLRPVSPEHGGVIPMSPELRVDNSAGRPADSARSGAGDETGGQAGLGGRNRFFRSIARDGN
jgi:flagellar biogenesis protein FliO